MLHGRVVVIMRRVSSIIDSRGRAWDGSFTAAGPEAGGVKKGSRECRWVCGWVGVWMGGCGLDGMGWVGYVGGGRRRLKNKGMRSGWVCVGECVDGWAWGTEVGN